MTSKSASRMLFFGRCLHEQYEHSSRVVSPFHSVHTDATNIEVIPNTILSLSYSASKYCNRQSRDRTHTRMNLLFDPEMKTSMSSSGSATEYCAEYHNMPHAQFTPNILFCASHMLFLTIISPAPGTRGPEPRQSARAFSAPGAVAEQACG
jgi:hypothetical protein